MPAISPLVPSRLILNLSPAADEGGGVTTRWQRRNSIQLQFVSKLVRLSPHPPPSNPNKGGRSPTIASSPPGGALSHDVDALLPFPQPADQQAAKNHRIQNRESLHWHAGMFTWCAPASPALPLSPPAFGCLHGISQAAPRPNMHRHRRPCLIPMAS